MSLSFDLDSTNAYQSISQDCSDMDKNLPKSIPPAASTHLRYSMSVVWMRQCRLYKFTILILLLLVLLPLLAHRKLLNVS